MIYVMVVDVAVYDFLTDVGLVQLDSFVGYGWRDMLVTTAIKLGKHGSTRTWSVTRRLIDINRIRKVHHPI